MGTYAGCYKKERGKDATHHAHAFLQDCAGISHPVLNFVMLVGGIHGGHDEDVGHEVG
jgi:hypothetical protein